MTRWTTPRPVSGRSHRWTIFGLPSLATCSMRTSTRRAPWTRSIAPPMPLTIFPGIIQLAMSPFSATCIAPRIAASTFPPRIIAKLVAESNVLAPRRSVTVSLPASMRSASTSSTRG